MRGGWIPLSFALALALAGCEGPVIDLQLPAPPADGDDDRDDDGDEGSLVRCDAGAQCTGTRKVCHPRGFCVECIGNNDCLAGQRCDGDDFECEWPGDRD